MHRFDPQGVTGFTLAAPSRLSRYTWPGYGFLVLDSFTGGDQEQADHFLKGSRPGRVNRQVLRKGFQYFPERP